MAPDLVAGGGYGGLFREKSYCAKVLMQGSLKIVKISGERLEMQIAATQKISSLKGLTHLSIRFELR